MYIFIYVYICTHVYVHIYLSIFIFIFIHIHIYTYIYTYVYVCIYMYFHKYVYQDCRKHYLHNLILPDRSRANGEQFERAYECSRWQWQKPRQNLDLAWLICSDFARQQCFTLMRGGQWSAVSWCYLLLWRVATPFPFFYLFQNKNCPTALQSTRAVNAPTYPHVKTKSMVFRPLVYLDSHQFLETLKITHLVLTWGVVGA